MFSNGSRKSRKLRFEGVEERMLMAADVGIDNGVLNVTGTDGNDVIEVQESTVNYGNGVVVKSISATVKDQFGNILANGTFAANSINSVKVDAKGGNDTVVNSTDKIGRLHGGAGNDYIQGGSNRDYIYGGTGHDTLKGGAGNDYIHGGSGNDKIYGQSGNDSLHGGSWHDTIYGGAGNDYITDVSGFNKLYGEAGNDYIQGGNYVDHIYGGTGHDTLKGGAGNDVIHGQSGNDFLYGEAGTDTLKGGSGNDLLDGGKDGLVDQLMGEAGEDTFVFWSDPSGNVESEEILDWMAEDQIKVKMA